MKYIFILSFTLFFTGISFSQQGKQLPKYLREANKAFDAKNYFDAITKCQDAFKKLGTKGSIKDKGNMALRSLKVIEA